MSGCCILTFFTELYLQFKNPLIVLLLASAVVSMCMQQFDDAFSITAVRFSVSVFFLLYIPRVELWHYLRHVAENEISCAMMRKAVYTASKSHLFSLLKQLFRKPGADPISAIVSSGHSGNTNRLYSI